MGGRHSRKRNKSSDNRPVLITDDNRPVVKQYKNELYVCALDFGRTYVKYAYCSRDNPNDILCPHWRTSTGSTAHKTTTTVLLDDKQKFVAFGYEAEEMFFNFDAEKKKKFCFFQRFQLNLFDKFRSENVSTKTKISDINGKEVPAMDIFSTAIKYIEDHLLSENNVRSIIFEEKDIKLVLIVPEMWGDSGKQFIIQAAKKAGIEKTRIAMVFESEAAYIFCKDLPVEKFKFGLNNNCVFSLEQRYLVLNAEDETIDTTVLNVMPGGKLHVLRRASWGDCGGAMVENTFGQMLVDIVGEEFMDSFRQNYTVEYIDILRAFNIKIREGMGRYYITRKITFVIPSRFLEKYQEKFGTDVSKRTLETRYAKSLKWYGGKMQIDIDLFQSFFDPANKKIVHCIREMLSKPEVKETNVILMVGSFSECEIVQEAIRKAFPECQVVVPYEAGLAILKGAVLFGHSFISDDDNTSVLEEDDNRPVVALDNIKLKSATGDMRSNAATDRRFRRCSIL